MNKRTANLGFYILILLLTFNFSCSSIRKTIKEPLKEQGTDFLIDNLKANELDYENLSAKFSATFKQNRKETQLTGQIRILRDSVIWVSVSPFLGIEMVRLFITNDSVFYLNRMESIYFKGGFDNINILVNSSIDYDMLQSFLTGNDFSEYDNTSFKGGIDNKEYTLTTTNRRKIRKSNRQNADANIPLQHIWLDPETFKINRIMIKELSGQNRKAEAVYQYEKMGDKTVPVNINFEVETKDNNAVIDINYSKITIGEQLQFPFNIPDKYTRINNLK